MQKKYTEWYQFHYCLKCRRPLTKDQYRHIHHFDNPRNECKFCNGDVVATGWSAANRLLPLICFLLTGIWLSDFISDLMYASIITAILVFILIGRLALEKLSIMYTEFVAQHGEDPSKWPSLMENKINDD